MTQEMVFIEKVGSKWWILKTKGVPNTHISGTFDWETKRGAIAYAERLNYRPMYDGYVVR